MKIRVGNAFRHCLMALALIIASEASAQTITYRVTVPEPQHHWLQVEATFPNLGTAPLRAFMSRSSPGRYAVHDFAKNVFWLEAFNGRGQALKSTRPNPYQWDVAGHDGTVRLVYKVFGDRVDGTYLAIDSTHAHMNMPATFIFDLDRQDRPMQVTFTPPPGSNWKVATQLFPSGDLFTFTAPNLQYFMDSPTEFSAFVMSTFSLPNGAGTPAQFRIAAHADASQADVDELAKLVQRVAKEQQAIFGEFPEYEPGSYTFVLDYWPGNDGDGMEHRNSTVVTSPDAAPLKTPLGRQRELSPISHEFFHTWNVERLRPAGLEPFDFTRANVTCCLWLAEGFTDYYGSLSLTRAGLGRGGLPANPAPIINGSGREVRSAVQMSEYAPFFDAAASVDPTDQSRSFISYYEYGAVIALGLDLAPRDLSNSARSLDDFMRALWLRYGRPPGPRPGWVATPYTLVNLRETLSEVAGNRTFANEFFDRYIEGREVVDYARLLDRAGFALRRTSDGAAWTGAFVQSAPGGVLVVGGVDRGGNLLPFGTPAYRAGLEVGDLIQAIDGQPATPEMWNGLRQRKVGDRITLVVVHRGGVTQTLTLTLQADPTVTVADLGTAMTPAQRAFRDAWLGSKVR